MRITCRYIRENALLHPPELNEAEGKHKTRVAKDYLWKSLFQFRIDQIWRTSTHFGGKKTPAD